MTCFEPTKYLPRDWPNSEQYAKYLSELGISNNHHLIIYDRSLNGFASSSRAWMHLRANGHENISILKGGLTLWVKKNFDVTDEIKTFPVRIKKI